MVLLNYNTYLNEPLKLVEKTFAFYRKSAKTAKVLYRGGFVVYDITYSIKAAINFNITFPLALNVYPPRIKQYLTPIIP